MSPESSETWAMKNVLGGKRGEFRNVHQVCLRSSLEETVSGAWHLSEEARAKYRVTEVCSQTGSPGKDQLPAMAAFDVERFEWGKCTSVLTLLTLS